MAKSGPFATKAPIVEKQQASNVAKVIEQDAATKISPRMKAEAAARARKQKAMAKVQKDQVPLKTLLDAERALRERLQGIERGEIEAPPPQPRVVNIPYGHEPPVKVWKPNQ